MSNVLAVSKYKMEYFIFLNRLRESGETNMFGASPYVQCAFSTTKREAQKIVAERMAWVSADPSNRDLDYSDL